MRKSTVFRQKDQERSRDHNNDLLCSKCERLKQVGNLRVLPFDATGVEYEVTQCLFFKHSGNWRFYEIFLNISFLKKWFLSLGFRGH